MSGLVTTRINQIAIRDRDIVRRVDRQRFRLLRRYGAIQRREARNKMRRKGRPGKRSQPGQSPLVHSPEPNFRTILYGLERDRLVVGAIGFGHSIRDGEGPQLAEHGGRFVVDRETNKTAWYRPRPVHAPAFEATSPILLTTIREIGLL